MSMDIIYILRNNELVKIYDTECRLIYPSKTAKDALEDLLQGISRNFELKKNLDRNYECE